MTSGTFTDDELMAFADGEAGDALSAAIREAALADPELTLAINRFRESRVLARLAFPLEPVSGDLEARIRAMALKVKGSTATSEPDAIRPAQRFANDNAPRWRMPLAASIVFALGLGGGYLLRGPAPTDVANVSIAGLVDRDLKSALESVPSGGETAMAGGKFRAIASFRNKDANVCREFEKDVGSSSSIVGVACHENGNWSVNTVVASGQNAQGYAPASSLEAIDAYVEAIGAEGAMTLDEERKSLLEIANP